jgi:ferredoxin
MTRLVVDFRKCEKSGECYYNHPRLFGRNDNGFPIVAACEIVEDDLRREALEAIAVCPAQAISIVD